MQLVAKSKKLDRESSRSFTIAYLIWHRIPSTSTFPSLASWIIPIAKAMKQPVRPIPALQWTTIGPDNEFTSAAILTSASAAWGTAWSGHESYLLTFDDVMQRIQCRPTIWWTNHTYTKYGWNIDRMCCIEICFFFFNKVLIKGKQVSHDKCPRQLEVSWK